MPTPIVHETFIPAPPERCFDLARDVGLHLASLGDTGERAIAGRTSGLLGPGETVTWRARHLGVAFELTARIATYDRPRHFRDVQVAGPFAAFVHDHHFDPAPDGTLMRDVLAFRAPFGPLGRLAEALILRRHLRGVLVQRAEAIARHAAHGDGADVVEAAEAANVANVADVARASLAPTRLLTPRLELRPLEPADAPALLAIFGDPEVMRYWSTPPWTSIGDAHALLARDREGLAAGTAVRWGIVRRADGALIGTGSLFDWSRGSRRAELGYALARSAWGEGFAREAVTAILDHGFHALELNRVEADIDPRNAASARLLDRLGFRREGLLRERWIVGGEVTDSALYGLLRSEWRGMG